MALLTLGGWECGEPLLEDTGFDLWCGDALCAWQTEAGAVKRVSTWHRSDFGVELIGDLVSLSQLSKATSTNASCFEVALQADTDDGVGLELEMDFFDDGVVEYTHPLASDNWRTVRFLITPPSWYDGLRIRVIKRGKGRAIVARIRIAVGSGCTAPPLQTTGRPLGSPCERGSQCISGRCPAVRQWRALKNGVFERGVCSSCELNASCGGAQICGHVPGEHRYWYLGCVDPAVAGLGERCAQDGECDSGTCCEGICSACCATASKSCPGGASCAPQFIAVEQLTAWQCGAGSAKAGEGCLRASDCASSVCQSIKKLRQCLLDGLPCQAGKDCLWGVCLDLGAAKGVCK